MRNEPPALIVLGGFAGTGKTFLAKRLSAELGLPRLGSDTIGRTISQSEAIQGRDVNAYWLAHEVLFRLSESFLQSGVSTILDLNMGWEFQWRSLDAIKQRHPEVLSIPIVLRCSQEICIERIRRRHAEDPSRYDPPELFVTEPKIQSVWEFLSRLDRPDAHFVDAARPADEVYEEVTRHVTVCRGSLR